MAKTKEEVQLKISTDIDQLVVKFKDYQKDGLKSQEVIKFVLDAATALVQIVEEIGGIPGLQKKEVVIKAVKDIYARINPNIPILPEAIEAPLEKWLLDLAVPPFIDFIVGVFNKEGVFAA
jgi:dihydroorotate dehydrogenase